MSQCFLPSTVTPGIDFHAKAKEAVSCRKDAMRNEPRSVASWTKEAPEMEATPHMMPIDLKAE